MKPTIEPKRTAEQRAEEEAIRRQHAANPIRQRPAGTVNQQSFASILRLLARFKAIRESQGRTLAEVAERMGIDPPALSRLETGKLLNPTLATLHKWAEAVGQKLDIDLSSSLDGEIAMNRRPDPQESDEETLLGRLPQVGIRQRAEFYFDLVRELIQFTGLKDGDPRLVMRMGHGGSLFDITINKRSVLAAERHYVYRKERPYFELRPREEHTLELIFPKRLMADLAQISPLVLGYSAYKAAPRLWVRFSVPSPFELASDVRQYWREAALAERDSGQRASANLRKYHQPILYRVAMDIGYRRQLLDRVWRPQ